MRSSGTPVLSAIPPSVSPTWTVYVLSELSFFADFFFAAAVDVFVAVVVLFVDVLVDESLPGVVVPVSLEPLTIARKATSTAISAKGARKRAGLLLVR
jgi:hypothetical protein